MKSKEKLSSTKKSKNKKMTTTSAVNTPHQPMDVKQALISQQQFLDYVNSKRELYDITLEFLENSESNDDFNKVINIVQTQCIEDREEFEHFI